MSDRIGISAKNFNDRILANRISKPNEFVFSVDVNNAVLISPSSENKTLYIVGVTITTDSTTGEISLLEGLSGELILPVYLSTQSRGGTSGNLLYKLQKGESLNYSLIGLQTNKKAFIGITYVEID